MPTAVVTPTFNEASNVAVLVRRLLDTRTFRSDPQARILVVDDGSPDGTAEVAEQAGAGRVRVIRRGRRQGLASAYREGLEAALEAGFDPVVQMDADLSHDPADVDRLVETDGDLVLGTRWMDGGGSEGWPLARRWLSRAGTRYVRFWLGLPQHDLTGGFKAWRASCLRAVDLRSVRSEGYVFQVETTWRAVLAGFQVAEVPIVFARRASGTSKLSARIALEAAWRIPTFRWQR
ncbi:MAG: polyprenol monophosphomannose synthase [Deltaproteobacteria bacterium]|nr:polyprenol monophosphomannose synthase [Deltaproteobacteria bacterium]